MPDSPSPVGSKFVSFEADGADLTITVAATHRSVRTKSGKVCPIVLEGTIDGRERALWAWPKALQTQLLDELESRGAEAFESGERIQVIRGAARPSKSHPGRSW